jgi:hypothetical protein
MLECCVSKNIQTGSLEGSNSSKILQYWSDYAALVYSSPTGCLLYVTLNTFYVPARVFELFHKQIPEIISYPLYLTPDFLEYSAVFFTLCFRHDCPWRQSQ